MARPSTPYTSRLTKLLPWLGALVLAAGVVVFSISVFGDDDSSKTAAPRGEQQVVLPPPAPKQTAVAAKLDPDARRVAGKFILTAVARKNLAESWNYVHPELRSGLTKAQWVKGDIPVIPFPVGTLDEARFRVDEIYAREMTIEVALIPKPGVKMHAQTFILGLKAVGNGTAKKWLVNYWMSRWTPRIPTVE